jgi:hypothetical protein
MTFLSIPARERRVLNGILKVSQELRLTGNKSFQKPSALFAKVEYHKIKEFVFQKPKRLN